MTTLFRIFTLLFLSTASSFGQGTEENLVKDAFNNYKSAILNDKGEEALGYIDAKTIKYYTDILETVKKADSATGNSLSLIDKITVFSIRHRATKEEVMKMDGKGLFVYAIKKGMVGKNSVANNSIGDVTIDKEFAKGQLIVSGQKTPLYFHFYKELGQWKLNLISLFPVSNIAFRKMVEDSGENENDYLFMLLETLTGKKPGAGIWRTIE